MKQMETSQVILLCWISRRFLIEDVQLILFKKLLAFALFN